MRPGQHQNIPDNNTSMKKTTTLLVLAAVGGSLASAESIIKPINDQLYGTITGRIQSLTMYRDYDGIGNGYNTNLGIVLGYTSPDWAGFDLGVAYNYAFALDNNNRWKMLANDDINVINEGWLRYSFDALGLEDTAILAGRKINNGEVFRADDFRQKARSIESVMFQTEDIPNTVLTVGHAYRLSNWIDAGDRSDFNKFDDIFRTPYDTDGVTWAEGVYTGFDGWEIALFDAYAWDVSNLIGTRVKWSLCDEVAFTAYYRHEGDVGKAASRNSDSYGLSMMQKVGPVSLEAGYFGVRGNTLRFNEATTGINHPLGSSMMIYGGQFNGGSDTAYFKAVAKIDALTLYALYNYTWQDHNRTPFDGQELNFVAKYKFFENFTAAAKVGVGYRDRKNNTKNTTAVDTRLFLTYSF
jgi:hypothetical protein